MKFIERSQTHTNFNNAKLSPYQVQVKVTCTCIRCIVSNSNGAKYYTNNKPLDILHLFMNILFKYLSSIISFSC